MSVSGISTCVTRFPPPRPPIDDKPKVDVSNNADGSKSLEISRKGPAGSTVSTTVTKDADGNQSVQITRTLADGSSVQRELSVNADGSFSRQMSVTGDNGGTLDLTVSGTHGDHALTYTRTAKYTAASGASSEHTVSDEVSADARSHSVEDSVTTASGVQVTRSREIKIDDHSILAALKLSIAATGGSGGTPASGDTGSSGPSTAPATGSST